MKRKPPNKSLQRRLDDLPENQSEAAAEEGPLTREQHARYERLMDGLEGLAADGVNGSVSTGARLAQPIPEAEAWPRCALCGRSLRLVVARASSFTLPARVGTTWECSHGHDHPTDHDPEDMVLVGAGDGLGLPVLEMDEGEGDWGRASIWFKHRMIGDCMFFVYIGNGGPETGYPVLGLQIDGAEPDGIEAGIRMALDSQKGSVLGVFDDLRYAMNQAAAWLSLPIVEIEERSAGTVGLDTDDHPLCPHCEHEKVLHRVAGNGCSEEDCGCSVVWVIDRVEGETRH